MFCISGHTRDMENLFDVPYKLPVVYRLVEIRFFLFADSTGSTRLATVNVEPGMRMLMA